MLIYPGVLLAPLTFAQQMGIPLPERASARLEVGPIFEGPSHRMGGRFQCRPRSGIEPGDSTILESIRFLSAHTDRSRTIGCFRSWRPLKSLRL